MYYSVLLVIHTLLVVCLIGIILIQRSDSDGFGAGGGSNQFLTGRASATLMTRVTAILAALFIANSLLLAYLTAQRSKTSIVETVGVEGAAPVATGAPSKPAPAKPAGGPAIPTPE